jgi:hypothetical protein
MKKGSGLAENRPTPRRPESPFAPAQQLAAARETIDRARQDGAGAVGDEQLAALDIGTASVPAPEMRRQEQLAAPSLEAEDVPAAEMRRQERLAALGMGAEDVPAAEMRRQERLAESLSGSPQIAFFEPPVAIAESREVIAVPSTGSGSADRRPTEIVGSLLSAAAICAVAGAILGGFRNEEEPLQS